MISGRRTLIASVASLNDDADRLKARAALMLLENYALHVLRNKSVMAVQRQVARIWASRIASSDSICEELAARLLRVAATYAMSASEVAFDGYGLPLDSMVVPTVLPRAATISSLSDLDEGVRALIPADLREQVAAVQRNLKLLHAGESDASSMN